MAYGTRRYRNVKVSNEDLQPSKKHSHEEDEDDSDYNPTKKQFAELLKRCEFLENKLSTMLLVEDDKKCNMVEEKSPFMECLFQVLEDKQPPLKPAVKAAESSTEKPLSLKGKSSSNVSSSSSQGDSPPHEVIGKQSKGQKHNKEVIEGNNNNKVILEE